MTDQTLQGKTALVCGASEGIGAAIATQFAQSGAHLVLVSRRLDALKAMASKLPGTHEVRACDFANESDVEGLAQFIAKLPRLDVLVVNAGGPPPNPPLETSVDEVKTALQIHLYAAMRISQAAVPVMKKNSYGRIVNVVSVTARVPLVHLTASNIVRGAVLAWAKTLSESLAPQGITVNNVLPGYTGTARLHQLVKSGAAKTGKSETDVEKGILQGIPFGRFGAPEEIAAAALFLASPASSYVTGTSLQVDGGFIRTV